MANFLSNLPAYRTGVSPLLRGVEVGLAHGFFVAGPFIKARPAARAPASPLHRAPTARRGTAAGRRRATAPRPSVCTERLPYMHCTTTNEGVSRVYPPALAQLGPLRATEAAEVAGSLSAAGLVLILTVCLSIYGAVSFQQGEVVGVKTLTGRKVSRDPLKTSEGWGQFASGWLVGGLSGVAWAYILTQTLPYYS